MSHAGYMPEIFIPKYFEMEVDKIEELIKDKFPDVNYIAASGISGVVISGAVCYKIGKNIFINRKPEDNSHSMSYGMKRRDNEYEEVNTNNPTAIIIDDLISSGTTVKRIVNELKLNEIKCIGVILYHESAYNGALMGEDDLAFPIYSTNQAID